MARPKSSARGSFADGRQKPQSEFYRCKIGGELKPLAQFSAGQQKILLYSSGVDAGITCLQHSRFVREEIKCARCGRTKALQDYSKSQRREDEPRCLRCVAWAETCEPDVAPGPAETDPFSPDEINGEIYRLDPENSCEDVEDSGMPRAPITDFKSIGLDSAEELEELRLRGGFGNLHIVAATRGKAIDDEYETVSTISSAQSNVNPSHGLFGRRPIFSQTTEVSEHRTSAKLQSLPPHLRGRIQAKKDAELSDGSGNASDSGLSSHGEFGCSSTIGTGSISTATTMKEAQDGVIRAPNVQYNAWGPNGTHRKVTKSHTVTSSSSSVDNGSQRSTSGGDFNRGTLGNATSKNNERWPKAEKIPKARSTIPPVARYYTAADSQAQELRRRLPDLGDEDDIDSD